MKVEFKRRLIRLDAEIKKAIEIDSSRFGLFPALASVYSYIWCNNTTNLDKL